MLKTDLKLINTNKLKTDLLIENIERLTLIKFIFVFKKKYKILKKEKKSQNYRDSNPDHPDTPLYQN